MLFNLHDFSMREKDSYSRELDKRVARQEMPYGYEERPLHVELEVEGPAEPQQRQHKRREK